MTGFGPQEPHPLRGERRAGVRLEMGTQQAGPELASRPLWGNSVPNPMRLRAIPRTANTMPPQETAAAISMPAVSRQLPPAQHSQASPIQMTWNLADRASRLTMDAIIIIVFSPVIAVWWLLERRQRKPRQ